MTAPDPGQQYPQANQPPQYAAPGAPGYAAPGYGQPAYGAGYAPGVPGPGEPYDGALSADDLSRPLYGASFGQAAKRFFKQYANFSGRASRSEYWWAQLFIFLLELIPLAFILIGGISSSIWASLEAQSSGRLVSSLFMQAPFVFMLILGGILMFLVGLAMIIPQISLSWRRLHDANLAGPFWFLTFTSVGSIIVFIFTLLRSKPEGRRFISSR